MRLKFLAAATVAMFVVSSARAVEFEVETDLLLQPVLDVTRGDSGFVPGLGQLWYSGDLRGDASAENAAETFGLATPANFPPVPFANSPWTWWTGQNPTSVATEGVERLPSQLEVKTLVDTLAPAGEGGLPYSVKFAGQILLGDGSYLLRDGVDDFVSVSIDVGGDGLDESDVILLDNNWTNFQAAGNPNAPSGGSSEEWFDVTGAGGGEWRDIEILWAGDGWMNGGMYLTKDESPASDDWPDWIAGEAFTPELQEKYLIPNDILRFEKPGQINGGTATVTLSADDTYVMDVSSTTLRSDLLSVQSAGGLAVSRMDLSAGTVKVNAVGELVPGDEFVLFNADELLGEDTLTLVFDDPSQWDTSGLSNDEYGGHRIKFIGMGPALDCNGDGEVNAADFACSNLAGTTGDLQTELHLLPGDFDGVDGVAFPDFLVLAANFGNANASQYSQGDIDGVGGVAFPDFLALAANFGQSAPVAAAVPEPSSLALLGLVGLVLGLGLVRRRRSR